MWWAARRRARRCASARCTRGTRPCDKRATRTVGAGTPITYTYDVNASLPLVLNDGTRKYVYGLGLAYTVDITGTLQVFHTDGLGSVRAITDSSGNIVQTFQSDEFGVALMTQGTSPEPMRYTGQQRDGESGFYDLRARYYAPGLGRFISRDPLFGAIPNPLSLTRYSYVDDNPTVRTDPSGLCGMDGSSDPMGCPSADQGGSLGYASEPIDEGEPSGVSSSRVGNQAI
jgi:RHS repeat-associated protein